MSIGREEEAASVLQRKLRNGVSALVMAAGLALSSVPQSAAQGDLQPGVMRSDELSPDEQQYLRTAKESSRGETPTRGFSDAVIQSARRARSHAAAVRVGLADTQQLGIVP